MIDSKQLREENLVIRNSDKSVHLVDCADIIFCHHDPNYFSPINLSPSVLECCGFMQDPFISREFNKKGDYDFMAIDHYEKGFLIICNFLQGGIMVKYLHTFQNLIFALTNTELSIDIQSLNNLNKVSNE